VLTVEFESNLLITSISLTQILAQNTNGEMLIKKDWIVANMLPAIWDAVDQLYMMWQVPTLESNFCQMFPSCNPDNLLEL